MCGLYLVTPCMSGALTVNKKINPVYSDRSVNDLFVTAGVEKDAAPCGNHEENVMFISVSPALIDTPITQTVGRGARDEGVRYVVASWPTLGHLVAADHLLNSLRNTLLKV